MMPGRRVRSAGRHSLSGKGRPKPVDVKEDMSPTPSDEVEGDTETAQMDLDNDGPEPSQLSQSSTQTGDDFFVTSPPKRQGLTGGLSTLFRRSSSGDGGRHSRSPKKKLACSPRLDSPLSDDQVPNVASAADEIGGVVASGDLVSIQYSSTNERTATSVEEEQTSLQEAINSFAMRGRSKTRSRSHNSKRIFYSRTDEDSDDSFESRQRSAVPRDSATVDSESMDDDDESSRRPILRYRGFSTSISSLFLDESLVCPSIGCFGLILSNRTEHLLQVREHVRGIKHSKKQTAEKRSPSKIFSYLLLLTIILMLMTFVIWGFGNSNALADDLFSGNFFGKAHDGAYDDGYNYGDNNVDDAYKNSYNVEGDDYYKKYYQNRGGNNYNDDGANNNDDNGGNNADDANNAGGDDANNNGNNDDGANANAGDDQAEDKNDDYYAAADDDGGRRQLKSFAVDSKGSIAAHRGHVRHRITGIFKLRDYEEHLWEPVIDVLSDEWNRDPKKGRLLADANDDQQQTNDDTDDLSRDIASDIRTALFLTFLLVLGVLGRRRRMRTRFQLVRARAQDDRLYYASNSASRRHRPIRDELEDKAYEVACSHTILGCYPVDPPTETGSEEEELGMSDVGVTTRKRKPKHEDCMSRVFACLMASCCGFFCKCWFQCLSVCALAQEAREMRLLLPPRYQRVDFITHQPFIEYQKDVNDLRRTWMGEKRKTGCFWAHYNALSRLSRYILLLAFFTVITITATLLFNPRAAFSWPDAVLLIATFVQSFLVLFIVHWIFHKSDLSLDAVIKFFAAGFVIAVPSAVFFEGLLVNIILAAAWAVYEFFNLLIGEEYATWMASHYHLIWILGELFNAFIVAAVTEELCKYYTFRSVEHPDLVFLTGLDRQAHDEHALEGGHVAYPFASHQVSDLNRSKSDLKRSKSDLYRSKSFDSHRSTLSDDSDKRKRMIDPANTAEEFFEDEHDVRTYRQKAAAVTTGMISVAVGLACAENMMYVFILGGSSGTSTAEHRGDLYEEWIVLLFRSAFPIHALAAAMQSVNMIRKFVEGTNDNNHRIGVGRIILPAVLLHGTFDAILMGINVYIDAAWEAYLDDNEGNEGEGEPYNPKVVNFVAWCSICLATIIGFIWYYYQNRMQQQRLLVLEEEEKAATEAPTYSGPTSTGSGVHPEDLAQGSQIS